MIKPIIIPVHNQLPFLIKCVESVINKTTDPTIIIVDDGSDTETKHWIEESGLFYIRHDKPKGFTGAVNAGIDYAMLNLEFKCLCLLNSDTEIVTDNWFDKVEGYFDNKTGVCGVVSDNALSQSIKDEKRYFLSIDTKVARPMILIHGFCYFINKDLLNKIGHLDDITFSHYGSEDDYSIKSIKAGFRNVLIPSVFIRHHGEKSYSKEQRDSIVAKQSFPALVGRYGRNYISTLVKETIAINRILNR